MSAAPRGCPSPALIVAMIALVAAVAGTATALPGKKTIDKNDFKNNAVKSKAIAEGAVKSSEIKDAQVKKADLAEAEPFIRPTLGNGGENDCIWTSPPPPGDFADLNPVGYYKDPLDEVHLVGFAQRVDGPGGDAMCGGADPAEQAEDAVVFELPAGYRPANVEFVPVEGVAGLVAPDEGLVFSGDPVPAGAVFALDDPLLILDGLTFRASGPGTAPIESASEKPMKVDSLAELRQLLR